MSAERTKEPGSSECKIHRRKVSNIRSAWLPADQHKNEFTVVEKTDDVIDPFALFHRTTAARLIIPITSCCCRGNNGHTVGSSDGTARTWGAERQSDCPAQSLQANPVRGL